MIERFEKAVFFIKILLLTEAVGELAVPELAEWVESTVGELVESISANHIIPG